MADNTLQGHVDFRHYQIKIPTICRLLIYISTQPSCFPAGNLNSYFKTLSADLGCYGDENDFPYILAKTFSL